MIKAVDIVKTYYSKDAGASTAVKGLNIEFDDKGLVFVVGKSGSGKTTLLNLLSGMDSPDSGEIFVAGKSTRSFGQDDFDVYRNTYVGYVFQDFGLIEELNVSQNIALSLQIQGIAPTQADIDKALQQVGLEGYSTRRASELSGGQRQRVSIARALIKKSQIIFADEPTGSLDAETGKQIFDIFREIAQTRLVVIVSHDMESALRYGDRIITLSDGNIISDKIKTSELDLDRLNAEYDKKVDEAFVAYEHKSTPSSVVFGKTSASLPLGVATKMSMSNIKSTKIRFAFALLLSIVALGLFCLSYNMRSYDYAKATVANLRASNISTLMLYKYKENISDSGFVVKSYQEMTRDSMDMIQDKYGSAMSVIPLATSIVPYIGDAPYINTTYFVELDSFDDASLSSYYNSTLWYGTVPQIRDDRIEVMISDYIADLIMTNGAIFEGGDNNDNVIIPNRGDYTDILNKTYSRGNMPIKIVGIYRTDYVKQLDGVRKQAEFYKSMVGSNLLVRKDALTSLASGQSAMEVNIKLEHRDELDPVYMNGAIVPLIYGQQEVPPAAVFSILDKNAVVFVDKFYEHDAQGNIIYDVDGSPRLDTTRELGDNEIVVSFSTWATMNNYDNISSFADVYPEDFANETVKVTFNDNATYREPYSKPIQIVGVFDDYALQGNAMLQFLYPELNPSMLSFAILVGKATYRAFIDNSIFFISTFINLDINNTKESVRIITELKDNNIDAVSFMYDDISFVDNIFALLITILGYASMVLFAFVVFLVFNFMSSSVVNKKKEIGILRVLGAKGRDTAKIFAVEGVVLFVVAVLGAIVGTIIGLSFLNSQLTKQFATISTVLTLNPVSILLGVGAFALAIFIASAVPLIRIIRLRPIDAVRS